MTAITSRRHLTTIPEIALTMPRNDCSRNVKRRIHFASFNGHGSLVGLEATHGFPRRVSLNWTWNLAPAGRWNAYSEEHVAATIFI